MERSTFQGKLIKSATDAAAIKVHNNGEPPGFWMRLIRVFKLGKTFKVEQRRFFQVLRTDGCLFYGNDALRRRGGCCICLLVASGLTAKRFSIWVADADQGEFTYRILSKRFKLAVFNHPSPLWLHTFPHPCASQSEMDDKRGGHENTKKDFLTYSVRYLSRLYVGKTNGEEIWNYRPPDYPEHMTWKNPTSSPKDSTEKLKEKYKYLKLQIPNEKFTPEEQKAFEDFENGNINNLKFFMRFKKLSDQIDNMKRELHNLQPSDRILLKKKLTLLNDELSSDSSLLSSPPTASASSSPTATTASYSSTISRKRKDRLIPVPSKRSKTEMLKVTGISQSTAEESPVRSTAFSNQSWPPLVSSNSTVSNTNQDVPCTTNPYPTEAAAATNSQPSMASTSCLEAICTSRNHLHDSSHVELHTILTSSSVSSWTLPQESCLKQETFDSKIDKHALNDSKCQAILLSIDDSWRPIDHDELIQIMNVPDG